MSTCYCETCGEAYPAKRKALGYRLCLTCGEEAAREQRMGWCIVPLPKQGYTRVNKKI